MKELAVRFVDKECVIYSFDGGQQYKGVIKEVTDGAVLLANGDKMEVINLDFIGRIKELPKKDKKKNKYAK